MTNGTGKQLGKGSFMCTSREGNAPTAEVNSISQTDVLALLPVPVLVLAVSSTDTVPMLGMFSRPVRNSQAEEFALNSAEMYIPYRGRKYTSEMSESAP